MNPVIRIVAVVVISFLISSCTGGTGSAEDPTAQDRKVKASNEQGVTAEEAATKALKVGDKMPAFELPDAKNETIKSEDLLKEANLVLVFYRGGWCPYCNIYLKRLQANLSKIESEGGRLVAISAESPDDSLSTEQKNELKFSVLSDKRLEYSRKFGLVYQLAAETDKKYKENGIDLVVDNDMDKPELPISATYIVDKSGEIVYAYVEPDYKQRAKPETVIAELRKLNQALD